MDTCANCGTAITPRELKEYGDRCSRCIAAGEDIPEQRKGSDPTQKTPEEWAEHAALRIAETLGLHYTTEPEIRKLITEAFRQAQQQAAETARREERESLAAELESACYEGTPRTCESPEDPEDYDAYVCTNCAWAATIRSRTTTEDGK
jgi:hypothetical protein